MNLTRSLLICSEAPLSLSSIGDQKELMRQRGRPQNTSIIQFKYQEYPEHYKVAINTSPVKSELQLQHTSTCNLAWFHSSSYVCMSYIPPFHWFKNCPSCFVCQECPSGVVNEETFKEIYAQFFPQGGLVFSSVLFTVCVSAVFLMIMQKGSQQNKRH